MSDPALRKPVVAYLAVTRAIDAKAAEIASLAGAPRGDYDAVSGGWVRRFQGCDIYYSEATGAHEVHGEIKAKYDAVMGPAGRLGFPTTDEEDCPGGRYNYFAHGGIFWTGHTGPMVMSIAMINAWIAAGAQNTLGYPVIDQHQFGAVTPAQDPQTEWCEFENGGIVQTQDGILPALAATLSPGDLRTLIRSKFDAKMHESPDNVGLQPQIETVSVGGWGHGFWASTPRDITFQLHGFHDNGLAADTNFTIAIGLEFGLVWQTGGFSEPATKSLVAKLTYLRVTHESGSDDTYLWAPGQIVTGVASGLYKAFFPDTWPDPDHPEVPNGSLFVQTVPVMSSNTSVDVLDVVVAADGSLQILVNPLPVGPTANVGLFRQQQAQRQLDGLLG